MRVGFITYDSKVHFYNINKGLSQPQMMTVGDVGDIFVPLVEGFMVNAEESEAVIDALMEQIPAMFGETRETETVLGPVIQAGKEAFKVRPNVCVTRYLRVIEGHHPEDDSIWCGLRGYGEPFLKFGV